MTPDAIQSAAALLADLRVRMGGRTAQLDELPDDCRPQTLEDAYDIQDALRGLLEPRGLGPQVGWKIGCTSEVMQRYLGITHPCAGTLYRTTVYGGRAELRAADFFELGLECEIAVRLAADLPPRASGHSAQTVTAAVGGVMASVEIVDHRFRDFQAVSTPSLVADDFFSVGCVLGPEQRLDELGDLATLTGGFGIDGAPLADRGQGSAILGHPLTALAWLADHLIARGSHLMAGEVVTLGSVVKTIYPKAGTSIEAGFDRLPSVTISVSEVQR